MKFYARALFSALIVSITVGCASIAKVKNALFRSKPSVINTDENKKQVVTQDEMIDPLYLRTQADYHYSLGEANSLDGNSERAVEEFKLTLVYDPDSITVRLRLSAEFVKQGLLSEAVEQAEIAVKSNPKNEEARILLGGLYSSLQMYDLAKEQYLELQKINPDNTEVATYIGALLSEQKKYDEAEKYFLQSAHHPKNPNPYWAYYYIGRIQMEQGPEHYKKAEQMYLKAISINPNFPDGVISLTKLYELQKQKDRGIKLALSFQDQFGPEKKLSSYLSQFYLEKEDYEKAYNQLENLEGFEPDNLNIKVKLALILIEQKKYEEAITKLEEILVMSPTSDKIRYYLGAVYEETKNPKAAISHFEQIPFGSSYYSEAIVHASYLYKSLGDTNKALKVVEQALNKRDDVPQFYAYFASLLDEKKEYKKAIKILNDGIAKFPEYTQMFFYLGSIYDRLGDADKTIENMKKVLTLDENHIQAMNYLAYTYAEQSVNLSEAEELAHKAMKLQPEDGYILDTLGWVYFKQGKNEEAIRILETAHTNKPEESIISEHLGDAYYKDQLYEKAKVMYIKAVGNEKDEIKIRKIRAKIVALEKQNTTVKAERIPASTEKAKPAQ